MALWGNNDNVDSTGIVTCNYSTLEVIGSGTSFGSTGSAQVGDVIRFGFRQATGAAAAAGIATYFGDAVIVGIASTTSLTIGSTAGLNGVAIAATAYTVSQCPVYTVGDSSFSRTNTDKDTFVYGVAKGGSGAASGTQYETGVGWVGITTYNDTDGNLRVKKEILVAMSGISTGNVPAFPGQK